MSTVNVALPADLVRAAGFDTSKTSTDAARLIALELFREDAVSMGRAAELCATPLAAFMEFAASHGVAPLQYGPEDLENDRVTLGRLRL